MSRWQTELQRLIETRAAFQTAERPGFSVEQVRTLNAIERCYWQQPVEIAEDERGNVEVTYYDVGIRWSAFLRRDGSLDYTRGGAP
jgi:hypothetical protein